MNKVFGMPDLQHRQQKIQEKRKKTSFRDFLKEIASWRPLTFYQNNWMVSKYPETERIGGVQSSNDIEAFRDSLLDHWLVYDASKWFFEQFQELLLSFPQEAMMSIGNCENVGYADVVFDCRNVYIGYFVVFDCENILYTFVARENCHNVLNSIMVFSNSSNIYMSSGVVSSYNIFYARYIHNCSDIWFSTNMLGCTECILCDGLENASYCIENKQYIKEDYLLAKQKLLQQKEQFDDRYANLWTQAIPYGCERVSGWFLIDSKDVEQGYFSYNMSESRNVFFQWWTTTNEHVYDAFIWWADYGTHMYGIQWSWASEHVYCCQVGGKCSHIFYCISMLHCSYCLGCIGLRNKSYCIFNTQYTKEERHEKVDEIFAVMDKEWTLWDFFPSWMNPYYFNDTPAVLIDDSFTKEEVEKEWFLRREEEVKVDIPEGMEVVGTSELGEFEWRKQTSHQLEKIESVPPPYQEGQNVESPLIRGGGSSEARDGGVWKTWWIDPEIMKKVIQDEQGNVYRIVNMEYDFLMKHGLPLPRLHRLDRLKINFKVT